MCFIKHIYEAKGTTRQDLYTSLRHDTPTRGELGDQNAWSFV